MFIYKLGEVYRYIEGYVNPPINNQKYFGQNIINWMRVKDLKHANFINTTELNLSKEGFDLRKNNKQIFKKGTIVWSKSGTIGNVGILDINVCANHGILNIIPKQKILKKYLFYFLIKNKHHFKNLATGAVLRHLYGPNLMEYKINLPYLKIQQQIINIIKPFHMKIISNLS